MSLSNANLNSRFSGQAGTNRSNAATNSGDNITVPTYGHTDRGIARAVPMIRVQPSVVDIPGPRNQRAANQNQRAANQNQRAANQNQRAANQKLPSPQPLSREAMEALNLPEEGSTGLPSLSALAAMFGLPAPPDPRAPPVRREGYSSYSNVPRYYGIHGAGYRGRKSTQPLFLPSFIHN